MSQRQEEVTGSHQLPPGRRDRPRALVLSQQRHTILGAVMRVIAERGYVATRVQDVLDAAGISRRTFYDHFDSKEDAFLDAYDVLIARQMNTLGASFGCGESNWLTQARHVLEAFLDGLAAEPTAARLCIVDILASGPRGLQRRADAISRFEQSIFRGAPTGVLAPNLAAEAAIGGIYEVIYVRVLDGRVHELPALAPDLLYCLLLPFVGAEVAAAEHHAAVYSGQVRRYDYPHGGAHPGSGSAGAGTPVRP